MFPSRLVVPIWETESTGDTEHLLESLSVPSVDSASQVADPRRTQRHAEPPRPQP